MTSRLSLLVAWEELAALGSQEGHRVPETVEWARGLVNEVLHERLRLPSGDKRWRTLMPVAHGIVDLLARGIQNYHSERGRGAP
ncbi:MAG: hypothetical protein DMD89_18245 [Candidatus Rokuibacteriota bacterium]|nr:MAG: hypothetical protein DMD89_18245 [Candidatus Rokubacteria bacterium]